MLLALVANTEYFTTHNSPNVLNVLTGSVFFNINTNANSPNIMHVLFANTVYFNADSNTYGGPSS